MRHKIVLLLLTATVFCTTATAQKKYLPYQNPKLSIEERVNDLLLRMTLDEKIDQLSMKSLNQLKLDENGEVTVESLEKLFGGQSIGCLESPFIEHEKIAKYSEAADKYLREKTRLGIPGIQIAECLHGQMALGATIFPQAIGQGSTWNPELMHKMGEIISTEASLSGVDQALSPLFDLGRDPRYGRIEECYGEDAHLVSQMGIAFVKGMQGDPEVTKTRIPENRVMCTAKHFVGCGIPQAGIFIAPAVAGERELRSLHLKPFEDAVKKANIYSVMPGYHEVDGVPVHGSRWLLTDVLRKEWGFEGYVFSDYTAIQMMQSMHKTTGTKKETARKAITAGVDLEAPGRSVYGELKTLIENGELDESVVDISVKRILAAKFKTGMFDRPFNVSKKRGELIHTPEYVTHARKMAEESIVLLKNSDQLLPLDKNKIKSVAVIGPNAAQVQFGDYTVTKSNDYGVTLLQGIEQIAGDDVQINYARGCGITDLDKSGFEEAVAAANNSDAVVLAIGGTSLIYSGIGWGDDKPDKHNTCGEGLDRATLDPPGVQPELIRAIYETGKPVVLVMIHGRPYSIGWEKENIPAIVEAWYPGEQGGLAIANVLFGKVNPSGKLPVSVPRSAAHVPTVYDYKPSGRGYYHRRGTPENPGRDYVFSSPDPLFCFGHGLSYTSFEYSNLNIATKEIKEGEPVKVSVMIKNTGDRVGKEVVQLYLRDVVSSVTTPVKLLKGFQKIELQPGESEKIEFSVDYDELSLYNLEMHKVVEPGDFEVQIGSSSDDIRLEGKFMVVE
ncbi:glycoside hydrolase family 3 C-terminal domain-containing protein [Prolixibacteraceae bacterium Z1-6]|uniref:Glycoside hydrolase family 3 C-terminal domain-containing protein n=1 Tax=Draconibacterium aestuarii TaxID=2998507 RepID=A0A9X3J508_9BACT|nr:glycoside hydrolase family 3 C-terminal domain-containing protein [Prolixibacteraceae bacterium Z1-6]